MYIYIYIHILRYNYIYIERERDQRQAAIVSQSSMASHLAARQTQHQGVVTQAHAISNIR